MVGALNLAQVRKLLSSEHFSVDGTLIEAWASMKGFVRSVLASIAGWRNIRTDAR
jgi:hypothetical protein